MGIGREVTSMRWQACHPGSSNSVGCCKQTQSNLLAMQAEIAASLQAVEAMARSRVAEGELRPVVAAA